MSEASNTKPQREQLRQRYEQERVKRIRRDGTDQYIETKGVFSTLSEDPFSTPAPRAVLNDHVTFLFIGAGFSGVTAGANLHMQGIDDFRIIDGAGDFGGTWYWNRFPGAMCDTASMIYMPMLEETNYMPTRKYASGPEIRGHVARIAEQYNLRSKSIFSTKVTELRWDEEEHLWRVSTNRGDAFTAKYVALGTGPLHKMKLPGIPGIESFQGHMFHTARWDYSYTGGDEHGAAMEGLSDKRVGIIGTGATAVQCVPPLGASAGELFVFQRTPSAVDVRNNEAIDPTWFSKLEPGWQDKWIRNFVEILSMFDTEGDLIQDGMTAGGKRMRQRLLDAVGGPENWTLEMVRAAYEFTDDVHMTSVRERTNEVINDPETADKLKAWYRQFCKRPCFHDEYLPTFNRENVHLIDTDGCGVERIDETGVWVGGQHYPLDCLIFATGYEVTTDYSRRAEIDVYGKNTQTLADAWRDGMTSLHGIHVNGFPNLFIVGVAQGAYFIANATSNFTDSAKTISKIVRHAEDIGANTVECDADAEKNWVNAMLAAPDDVIFGGPDCTPGYYNNEGGELDRKHKLSTSGYPLGAVAYFDYIEQWRNTGTFDGLIFD